MKSMNKKRKEASERAVQNAKLSVEERINNLILRPGYAKRENERLMKLVQAEKNPFKNKK